MFRDNSLRLSLFEPNKGQLIFIIILCHPLDSVATPLKSGSLIVILLTKLRYAHQVTFLVILCSIFLLL